METEETSNLQLILNNIQNNCIDSITTNNFNGKFCEMVFDGLMCWPRTLAGTVASQNCTNDFIKSKSQGFATKQCNADGTWYVSEEKNQTWTNYSACGGFYIELTLDSVFYSKWIPVIKHISHFGYTLSLICLIISLIIFVKIKRLHCARNKLHTHLFISFIMRSIMFLVKDTLFVKGTTLIHETEYIDGEPNFVKENYVRLLIIDQELESWICKAIISLRNYFIISNYMLLLMEGLYLYNLMFSNLFRENGVNIYCFLGWGLPVLFTIPWILLKITKDNFFCWTKNNNYYITWLIEIPIRISVVVNFILFTVIVRVLFIKLTSMYIQQRKIKYRKLLRSTLILLPLFGIPYMISLILSYYVRNNQRLEVFWLLFDQTFSAFQGVFVSLVYCIFNSEVQIEVKRKYNSLKDRNNKEFKRSRTISHTQQCSLPLNDDIIQLEKKDELIVVKTSDYF